MLPPGAGVLAGLRQPVVSVDVWRRAGKVAGLWVARRVDQTGNVPGVAEHKAAFAAEQLSGAVATMPWGQMIGLRAHEVAVALDRPGLERCTKYG
ncbi:hypothetical protein D3C81_1849530 [compost metagenome]